MNVSRGDGFRGIEEQKHVEMRVEAICKTVGDLNSPDSAIQPDTIPQLGPGLAREQLAVSLERMRHDAAKVITKTMRESEREQEDNKTRGLSPGNSLGDFLAASFADLGRADRTNPRGSANLQTLII